MSRLGSAPARSGLADQYIDADKCHQLIKLVDCPQVGECVTFIRATWSPPFLRVPLFFYSLVTSAPASCSKRLGGSDETSSRSRVQYCLPLFSLVHWTISIGETLMLLVYTIELLVLKSCIKSAVFSLLTLPVNQFLISAGRLFSGIHSLSHIVFVVLHWPSNWTRDGSPTE